MDYTCYRCDDFFEGREVCYVCFQSLTETIRKLQQEIQWEKEQRLSERSRLAKLIWASRKIAYLSVEDVTPIFMNDSASRALRYAFEAVARAYADEHTRSRK